MHVLLDVCATLLFVVPLSDKRKAPAAWLSS